MPSVYNFYFGGFGVRPGRANCDLTGVYDDLRVLGPTIKKYLSYINAKYDDIVRYMLKSEMVKYIIYSN
jgi:hypothetical protein